MFEISLALNQTLVMVSVMNSIIQNEIQLLKKQTPSTKLPAHLWEAVAKNSIKQKSFGFSVVDVTPKGFGPNE